VRMAILAVLTGLILLVPIVAEGSAVSAIEKQASFPPQNLDTCLVDMTGDVNLSGSITSADIIYLVRFVLLSGNEPEPCYGAGDANCSGVVNSADIVYLVNHVFKSGPGPCDFCTSGFHGGCIQ